MSAALTPPGSPFVVRADSLRAREDAASIRAAARAEAAQITVGAEAAAQAALTAARECGLREGAAQAARLAASAADAIDRFWSEREGELADLAFALAHRMLSCLPPRETLARLATTALAEHRSDAALTLLVAEAEAPALRTALAEADPAARVFVEADPAAPLGSCTLIHPRGLTRLGLVDQFRALMASQAA